MVFLSRLGIKGNVASNKYREGWIQEWLLWDIKNPNAKGIFSIIPFRVCIWMLHTKKNSCKYILAPTLLKIQLTYRKSRIYIYKIENTFRNKRKRQEIKKFESCSKRWEQGRRNDRNKVCPRGIACILCPQHPMNHSLQ